MIVELGLFALAWLVAIYLINSLLSRKLISLNLKLVFLYCSTVALLGVSAEILIGNIYQILFDKPLWNYTVYPVHDSYTSKFAPILWAIYGFQIYLLSEFLSKIKVNSKVMITAIFCIEAIIIEALVNLSFLVVFGKFVYYYFPSDLWHLTSIQTLPLYLAAGYVIPATIEKFKRDPIFFTLMSGAFTIILVFLA